MDIRTITVKFIKSLSPKEREEMQKMVLNGVKIGIAYANENHLDLTQFNNELKKIFEE